MPFRLRSQAKKRPAGSRELFETAPAGTTSKGAPDEYLVAHIDGGARGNPGPAGYGVVIEDNAGRKVDELSRFLGHATNNFAEYSGLIAALEYARGHRFAALKVMSDSELMVRQIKGEYKVKAPGLKEIYAQARKLIHELNWFAIEHIRREGNRDADRLANLAMDQARTYRG